MGRKWHREDLTGRRFGSYTVLEPALRADDGHRRKRWKCRCDCGKEGLVAEWRLLNGNSTRCRACGMRGYRKSYGEAIPRLLWWRIINGAQKRGLSVEVTQDDVWALFMRQNRRCALSGTVLVMADNSHDQKVRFQTTASLDRIDSSKGYVPGNLQWVHKELNRLKSDCPNDQFIEWCLRVATHHRDPVIPTIEPEL